MRNCPLTPDKPQISFRNTDVIEESFMTAGLSCVFTGASMLTIQIATGEMGNSIIPAGLAALGLMAFFVEPIVVRRNIAKKIDQEHQ